jgi:hypothetical protein
MQDLKGERSIVRPSQAETEGKSADLVPTGRDPVIKGKAQKPGEVLPGYMLVEVRWTIIPTYCEGYAKGDGFVGGIRIRLAQPKRSRTSQTSRGRRRCAACPSRHTRRDRSGDDGPFAASSRWWKTESGTGSADGEHFRTFNAGELQFLQVNEKDTKINSRIEI